MIGLPPSPSILAMERRYGYKWRSTNTDTQYFLRRKPLYEAIGILTRRQNRKASSSNCGKPAA